MCWSGPAKYCYEKLNHNTTPHLLPPRARTYAEKAWYLVDSRAGFVPMAKAIATLSEYSISLKKHSFIDISRCYYSGLSQMKVLPVKGFAIWMDYCVQTALVKVISCFSTLKSEGLGSFL
jgi:hypothetical protein